jgi:SAM-dependent MidA family methyltransferase
MSGSLPAPTPDAAAHSEKVRARVAQEIDSASGWIPFSRYMDLVLHAPGLGYYASGTTKFGPDGDFVTSPEISPLFGEAVAAQLMQVLRVSGGDLIELGAGSGRLASQILGRLQVEGCLPRRYLILEPSAELRERQGECLAKRARDHLDRIQWLDALPAELTGVAFGNEVLDALPVDLVRRENDRWSLRGVVAREGRFEWEDRPLAAGPLLAAARSRFPADATPYLSELNLASEALVRTLGERLARGALLFIDYGYSRGEYYHGERNRGTLMCHYRQRVHEDPFLWPGLQDITAHVDFTAMAEAAVDAGLAVAGYTSQASFLLNLGILDLLGTTPPENAVAYLPLASGVQRLTSPLEFGERFQAIAFTRGIEEPLLGFARGDRSARL